MPAVDIQIKYKAVKNISIRIKPNLEVVLTAPLGTPKSRIEQIVNERQDWINKHLNKFTEKEIKTWWTALERKLAKVSTKVSRVPGGKPNAYCLPGAYELSLLGVTRNINP